MNALLSVSESQLETWSNQGATTTAQRTHESVRNAISNYEWSAAYRFNDYLQGSYRNTTNIRGNSDVDLVTELSSVFYHNLSALTPQQQSDFHAVYSVATFGISDFRGHMERALRDYYGWENVDPKNKCIQVNTPHLSADVVVCAEYRLYLPSNSADPYTFAYTPGIVFWANGTQIINFPKQHIENGAGKNSNTKGWYKKTVRCFKNARSYLVDQGIIDQNLAPSYFVECLLYNVPDKYFGGSFKETCEAIVGYLKQENLSMFRCQNGITSLFGTAPTQWSLSSANMLIAAWDHLLVG